MKKLIFLSLAFIFLLGLNISIAQADGIKKHHQTVCGKQKDEFHCHAHIITNEKGKPEVITFPYGLGPSQLNSAYNTPGVTTNNQTIAIVDAYDDPNIFQDLNKYSLYFGIPSLSACKVAQGTTAKPCFQKVSQSGGTFYPRKNSNWALEISLDVEAVHAMCQNCNILLVEANSASYANLTTAIDRAVAMGAKIVSNSYGSDEFSTESQFDFHFQKTGIAFTFSSGDSGFGTSYPAASQYVTAVGGTTLNMNGNNYINESVWSGAGSGCSLYEAKPKWQADTGCANRTISDVSADADPNTGAAVYDSIPYSGYNGWFTVGGTSLASPIVAAMYALGGIPSGVFANSLPYNNPASLHDITVGSNGSCSIPYLCNAAIGYDGPTGLGTPNGISAF